jgi:phytoene synthase
VGESWYWWHARGEASSEASTEIGYWFPRLGDGWLCLPSENITGTDRFSGRDPAKSPWRAPFGVEAARAVTLSSGRDMHFAHMLEAAPFYARLKAVDAAGTHLGTLEALHPRRLRSRLTPFLMACRQTRTTRLGHGYGSHGFLETCRAVTSRNGRSFYLASHVLPESARAGAYFVYTLCRLIDDATDERPAPAGNAEAGSTESAALLDALFNTSNPLHGDTPVVAFVARALAASGGGSPADPVAGRAFALGFLREARLHARALGLERGPFEELVEGQRMDESFGQPGDFAAFYVYCFRVAGVVGLLMARVFGARAAPSTLEAAEHLGIAMQITNILRDVREDWEGRGRVYLPADACARHGVDIATAMGTQKGTPSGSSGGPALVRSLALRAIDYYRSALRGVPDIPSARARLCVRLMAAVYGAILGVILLDPSVPFRRRVVIPQARRLLIAMRVLLGGDPLVAAGLAKTGKD